MRCELTLTVPSICDVREVSLAECDVTEVSSIYDNGCGLNRSSRLTTTRMPHTLIRDSEIQTVDKFIRVRCDATGRLPEVVYEARWYSDRRKLD